MSPKLFVVVKVGCRIRVGVAREPGRGRMERAMLV